MEYKPEDFEGGTEKIKEIGAQILKIQEVIEDSPDRWRHFTKENGDTEILDLKCNRTSLTNRLNLLNVPSVEINDILKQWKKHFTNCTKKGHLVKKLNAAKAESDMGGKASLMTKKSILDANQAKIIELFGEGRTIQNIRDYFKSRQIEIGAIHLSKFKDKHNNLIREKFEHNLLHDKDFYLATDRGQLKELTNMEYYYAQKFEKEKKTNAVKDNTVNQRLKILDQIRKYVKGDVIHHTVDQKIDVDSILGANQALSTILPKINMGLFNIMLTSAQRGINPLVLGASLSNSYYKSVNGFSADGAIDMDVYLDLSYPSDLVKKYDLEEMVEKNRVNQSEGNIEDAIIVEDEKEIRTSESSRRTLQDILKERKSSINLRK